jgi:peptidoglycan-associated lipoprotein
MAALGGLLIPALEAWGQTAGRMEAGANYSFVRSNAPAGKCGCFDLNGGGAWFAYDFSPSLAVVGEVGGQYSSHINGTTADLTLTSFLAGPRYSRHVGKRMTPFGQILLGAAHANSALTPSTSGLAASANAFAMAAGGGMDVELTRSWTLRLVQLDYYLTRFNNGSNDHQNNLRVGTGIAFHFGRGK